jgi:hypothetical protein
MINKMNRISLIRDDNGLWSARGVDGKEDRDSGLQNGLSDGKLASVTTAQRG